MIPIKGQLGKIIRGYSWEYFIVTEVYDGMYTTINQFGGSASVNMDDKRNEHMKDHYEPNAFAELLYKSGFPVMAKKTLFGKYLFEPR